MALKPLSGVLIYGQPDGKKCILREIQICIGYLHGASVITNYYRA